MRWICIIFFATGIASASTDSPTVANPSGKISQIARNYIALSQEFERKQATESEGAMEVFIVQRFIPQNISIIAELDKIYAVAPTDLRENLKKIRGNLVKKDSEARQIVAKLQRKKGIPSVPLAPDLQKFVAGISSIVSRFQKADQEFLKKIISPEAYLGRIQTELWPELVQVKILLEQSSGGDDFFRPSEGVVLCETLLKAMQSGLRYVQTKNKSELSLQAGYMGRASGILAQIAQRLKQNPTTKSPVAQIDPLTR